MRRAPALFVAIGILMLPHAASAGAWTLPRGHWQLITATIVSDADRSYDGGGEASKPIDFEKALFQVRAEYGLLDTVTVYLEPQTVVTRVATPPAKAATATDSALEGGVRVRLTDRIGVLSLEASATAGTFNHAVLVNGISSGHDFSLRALYGTSFKWLGRDGFVDIEAGENWLSRPRPDETPIDLTMGLWVTPKFMVMAQSFNLIGGGGAVAPYSYYRSHKIELSAVARVSRHFSLQFGAFASPAGQNALVEQGVCLGLWTQT